MVLYVQHEFRLHKLKKHNTQQQQQQKQIYKTLDCKYTGNVIAVDAIVCSMCTAIAWCARSFTVHKPAAKEMCQKEMDSMYDMHKIPIFCLCAN